MLINANLSPKQEVQNKLPIKMYESIIDLVNNEATVLFVKINYTLVTEEAERIGLDHMARSSTTQQVCSNRCH